jgi:transcriptional regulator with XRE-family HTH domain
MTTYEQIVATLRQARIDQGLTLEAVTVAGDIASASAVGYWERGQAMPTFPNLIKWAAGLGYEVELRPSRAALDADPDIAAETGWKRSHAGVED